MIGGPGFYRGTSREQTPFFKDKDVKIIESRKWPAVFEERVDMSKVNADVMKAWVTSKLTSILGFEDDIVSSYCMTQLYPDEAMSPDVDARQNYLCPKKLVISMTGFIGKGATQFVKELWELLLAAQKEKNGIPPAFLENKKLEMQRKREEAAKINEELIRRHEQMMKDEFNRQVKDIATGHAQSMPPTVLAAAAAGPLDPLGLTAATSGTMRGWDGAGTSEPVITVPQVDLRPPEENEGEQIRRRAPSSSRSGSEDSDYGRRRRRRDRRFKERQRRDHSSSRSHSRSPPSPPSRERSRSRGRDRGRERRRRRSRSRDRR
ncbi:PWI domain-containing protein [Besnoitia besnoiti]|uniref:PWI domain-containing protein n=1 Tax=Besnoitia besnoiti TaxID=94643 RepID=A0A2A9MFE5_BESBE|nr:PWI domain-containing protein [Besnoitia besnoiti]PFH34112.1 PWI domain-containing protein [Besnoitia besnoiti]